MTKTAEADHSLPYMLAAALIDRELLTEQYDPERIRESDVQSLLQRVTLGEDPELTDRFENGDMPAVIDVQMENGTVHHVEKDDFRGHPNNSMSWDEIEEKFGSMAANVYDEHHRDEIIDTVKNLENRSVDDHPDPTEVKRQSEISLDSQNGARVGFSEMTHQIHIVLADDWVGLTVEPVS